MACFLVACTACTLRGASVLLYFVLHRRRLQYGMVPSIGTPYWVLVCTVCSLCFLFESVERFATNKNSPKLLLAIIFTYYDVILNGRNVCHIEFLGFLASKSWSLFALERKTRVNNTGTSTCNTRQLLFLLNRVVTEKNYYTPSK